MQRPLSRPKLWRPVTAALGVALTMVVFGHADAQVKLAKHTVTLRAISPSLSLAMTPLPATLQVGAALSPPKSTSLAPPTFAAARGARVMPPTSALISRASAVLPAPSFGQGVAALPVHKSVVTPSAPDPFLAPAREAQVAPSEPVAPVAPAASAAYIDQIGDAAGMAGRLSAVVPAVPQANLADQIAAMQVPPIGIGTKERAAMLATAPEQLSVRLGDIVLGKVAIGSELDGGVTVQLSGLLDLLEDRFEPDAFEQLRSAAAADAFVPVTRIADSGIAVEYNAAYDELTIG